MTNGKRSEVAQGYLYAILGSLCGGAVPTLTKILLVNNGPLVISGFSILLSGVILLLYQPRVKPAKMSIPFLLFFGLIGAALAPLMFTLGLNQTTAVNANLLANGEVLFTALIAFAVFGERMEKRQAARGLPIVLGIIIVSTNLDLAHVSFLQGLAGNLLVLGSAAAWALENNLIAVATRKVQALALSKFRNVMGGVALTVIVFGMRSPFGFSGYDILTLVLLALAVAGATSLFIAAIKRIGAVRMLLVWSSATVFGSVFALAVLGEQITIVQALGGVLILSGVYLFHRGEAGPEAEPFAPPAGTP